MSPGKTKLIDVLKRTEGGDLKITAEALIKLKEAGLI